MRGKAIPKREILSDPKYRNLQVAKFINYIMRDGKKITAQKIVYQAFDILQQQTKKEPLAVFQEAINNVAPTMEVRPRRVGGANYQIPFPVLPNRRLTLASRWLIEAARAKKGKPMAEKLAAELFDAASNQGSAIKKKNDMHRMAEANKAFAHFARNFAKTRAS